MATSVDATNRRLNTQRYNPPPRAEQPPPRTEAQPRTRQPAVLAQHRGESSFEAPARAAPVQLAQTTTPTPNATTPTPATPVTPTTPAPPLTGDLAPGGRFDPRRVGDETPGSQTLFANSTWGFPSYTQSSHHYATLSDPLPAGTTWAQANDALQRFNAPTADALRGIPGDGRSTSDWVAAPGTNLPAGRVTFERGDGWVRNTTAFPHPLVGQITRRVIADDQGRYRILTEGTGQGGPFGGIRHNVNINGLPGIPGGPQIFSNVDQITIDHLRRQQQRPN